MLKVSSPPPPYSSGAPRAHSPAALVLAERRTKSSSGISGASGSMRCSSGIDLVLDEAADLLAEHAQLVGQREAGEVRHGQASRPIDLANASSSRDVFTIASSTMSPLYVTAAMPFRVASSIATISPLWKAISSADGVNTALTIGTWEGCMTV